MSSSNQHYSTIEITRIKVKVVKVKVQVFCKSNSSCGSSRSSSSSGECLPVLYLAVNHGTSCIAQVIPVEWPPAQTAHLPQVPLMEANYQAAC